MNLSKGNFAKLIGDLKMFETAISIHQWDDSAEKSLLIAYFILTYNLQNYFEIGTLIGKSFLFATHAALQINGMAYGAFSKINISNGSVSDVAQSNTNLVSINEILTEFALNKHSKIFENDANISYLPETRIKIDLLHFNSSYKYNSHEQITDTLKLVKEHGFVVFDNSCKNVINTAFKRLKKTYAVAFANDSFTVACIESLPSGFSELEERELSIIYSLIENINQYGSSAVPTDLGEQIPTISVIVISFNQEKYIAECLQGIFAQKGKFYIELIISDDGSQDTTVAIIENITKVFDNSRVSVKNLSSQVNVGMTKNFQRALYACTGDYIAICEGDDFWIDCYKLQKQMDFLTTHPDCAICFNQIYLYYQENSKVVIFKPDSKLTGNIFTTKDLVIEHFIGNLSCCFYDAKYLKEIPEDLFTLFIGDWMFNIYYSQFGNIGYLDEVMSVYRKHENGVWAGMPSYKKNRLTYDSIDTYNQYLGYRYEHEFSIYQDRVMKNTLWDIAIIDDVAPHPLSAFRAQEFESYLKNFDGLKIYCSGISIHFLGKKTLEELILDFRKKYPEHAEQIEILKPNTIINAKLIYTVFLGNTFINIDEIERSGTPFVFTLYPGGFFGLHNERSDTMLKRVTSSPCFRKVIVTQKVTYDYLIDNKFCTPSQIEFIFGVVTPLEQLEAEYQDKKHFGINKQILDICFVAHKYTKSGVDKGYDIFIDVATKLSQKYQNIQFHVVGGFDESEIDVSHISHRIKFYGSQEIQWFDEFYKDKDIILSPNVPFKIFSGSFDGFPTGSCTDAGLRETAIFCTDELSLNSGFFTDGEEIVIIPHNADKIVDVVMAYYHNPHKLMSIAKNGREKIKKLYSYEAQLLPRIKILKEQVDLFEINKKTIESLLKPKTRFSRRFLVVAIKIIEKAKRKSPTWLKEFVKGSVAQLRSNEKLLDFLRTHTPAVIKKIYSLVFG
jgi:glycosyltransferase involved in cell wall biosynthesis